MLTEDRVIGPILTSENNVNRSVYLDMLEHHALSPIENKNLGFQQVGVSHLHYANIVHDFLNKEFTQNLIGQDRWRPLPPRSSNLALLDCHLWGYV